MKKKPETKQSYCYQCHQRIGFVRGKDGAVIKVDYGQCYFVPAPEQEGKQFVMRDGTIRWGYYSQDGLTGFKKHDCPYMKKEIA